jgi:hypothetical protein
MHRKQPKFANSRSGNQSNSPKKHGTGKGNWGDIMNDCEDPDFFTSSNKNGSAPKVCVSPLQKNFS